MDRVAMLASPLFAARFPLSRCLAAPPKPPHRLVSSISPKLSSKPPLHNELAAHTCIISQELYNRNSSSCAELRSSKGDMLVTLEQGDLQKKEEDFVEVGVITGIHGISGELHIRSTTDFPEERFEKPGLRWLKMCHMSNERIECVELVKGRNGPGKHPSWLITLKEIGTPEKAREFVGATMLARVSERPVLEDGEFYIPDLVGMSVMMKESGETIGRIVDVFSTGASDLLRVRLYCNNNLQGANSSNFLEHSVQELGPLIWIPFVKDIVPVVNSKQRIVEITPPTGLLELNMQSEGTAKTKQRKQEAKDKRKLKEKVAGLRKSLASLKQDHVLAGLKFGEKPQQRALLDQLLDINFTELQQHFQDALSRSNSLRRMVNEDSVFLPQLAVVFASWMRHEKWGHFLGQLMMDGRMEGPDDIARWCREGLRLIIERKVAVITLIGECVPHQTDSDNSAVTDIPHFDILGEGSPFQVHAEQLLCHEKLANLVISLGEFMYVQAFHGAKSEIRWLIVTTDATDCPTRLHFAENNFFGLNESQIWFCKQEKIPCFEHKSIAEGHHRILMETPWKIAQTYIGDGGIFSSLTDQGFLKKLVQEGRSYLQVHNMDCPHVRLVDPVLFGCLHDMKPDVGVEVCKNCSEQEVGIPNSSLRATYYDIADALSGDIEGTSLTHFGHASSFLKDSSRMFLDDSHTGFQDAGVWNIFSEHEESICNSEQRQEPVLQVSPHSNCVISMKFLTQLQKHQFKPLYSASSKEVLIMDESGEKNVEADAIQLKCSFFDFLRKSKPNKVAFLVSS
ncbi:hypothetical protein O6H91_22G004100 [Diphasiastrum complanatum]|uniref:Uncharacterized protein n=1 Tax=Diphasiastrum complanatum TaxID=34168 RepID=A0ACC2ACB3_DIPCM|nr:hypothetical protein O6H91_22G004100 [Diphasiastrum complanatum]